MSGLRGSQYLLQTVVNNLPHLLEASLRQSGALKREETVEWRSPIVTTGCREYRDRAALQLLGIESNLNTPLQDFWPRMGPVWDALGVTSQGRNILVEAKAHIPEAASPATGATPASRALIDSSLRAAQKRYGSTSKNKWSEHFYQYSNRLAYQYWLNKINNIPSCLVFLYFLNATDMDGPQTEAEWHGAERLIHAVLGIPTDLSKYGVYSAYLDAESLLLRHS